ncbi:MAG: hypothetical protein KF765_08855 [Parvibaculaceae bacterium]|nr:hypothetical protein [Parvibaculaceae bacterium]
MNLTPRAPRKLPVFQTLREVIAIATGYYWSFLSAASGLVAILGMGIGLYVWSAYRAGVDNIATILGLGIPGERGENPFTIFIPRMSSPEFWAGVALIWVASAFLAVKLHRFVLLKDGADDPRDVVYGEYIWTTIKISLVILVLAIGIIIVPGYWLLSLLVEFLLQNPRTENHVWLAGQIFTNFAGVLVSLVSVRVLLALPAAAVGGHAGVFHAFIAAHGNTWRLILCGLVVHGLDVALTFTLAVVCAVVSGFSPGEYGKLAGAAGFLAFFILGLPFFLYLLMVEVALLSVAYREIVGLAGGHEGEATVAEPTPGL